eukprot:TRINITY_DN69895_c0_g1_i1.p1 TRINITY_DN69895_c0_g1~~TRINITY_DN69895_c0_g1_i1.p1  ORF type:complete len:423 (-),score=50.60 TRINITY_DN69895_c0_g1_i1:219-1373(-)
MVGRLGGVRVGVASHKDKPVSRSKRRVFNPDLVKRLISRRGYGEVESRAVRFMPSGKELWDHLKTVLAHASLDGRLEVLANMYRDSAGQPPTDCSLWALATYTWVPSQLLDQELNAQEAVALQRRNRLVAELERIRQAASAMAGGRASPSVPTGQTIDAASALAASSLATANLPGKHESHTFARRRGLVTPKFDSAVEAHNEPVAKASSAAEHGDDSGTMPHDSAGGGRTGHRALDMVMLLVLDLDARKLRFAVEQVPCVDEAATDQHDTNIFRSSRGNKGSSEAAFLCRHNFLGRWRDETELSKDLIDSKCDILRGHQHTFAIEVDSGGLARSVGPGGSIELQVLPQDAFRSSWWINSMDSSADAQPFSPADGLQDWGFPRAL